MKVSEIVRYIGSKRRLIPFIENVIQDTIGETKNLIFADLFAGTACVGEAFKKKGAKVITNDYLCFSYALQVSKVKQNTIPTGPIEYYKAIDILNDVDEVPGFFYEEYTLEGTKNKEYQRNYFSAENARKIDGIRFKMDEWLSSKVIDENFFQCLSASLVDAVTKVSNTSGTYGAFLKEDDKRKFKKIKLEKQVFFNNYHENESYCEDIFDVIDKISGDILYLDPPYNNRQYPPYYHILETVVKYDNPYIYGKTGRRVYNHQMSPFCMKDKAEMALYDIFQSANFKHIFLSYSTEGIVNIYDFAKKLPKGWKITVFDQNYRRYKSNSHRVNNKELKEIILYVCK